jgi:hypothetical protein
MQNLHGRIRDRPVARPLIQWVQSLTMWVHIGAYVYICIQDSQCILNRNIRRVSVPIFALGKAGGIIYSDLCLQLSFLACNVHGTYYFHLWSVSLYPAFPHFLINGTTFRKKVLNIRYVLIFSTTLTETCLIPVRIRPVIFINVQGS